METAIFGLIGVMLGSFLTFFRDLFFQKQKMKKEADFLAVMILCELNRFAECCGEVVRDDGLLLGQTNADGCREIQVKTPTFDPQSLNVEWKSLPIDLMYEILSFPSKIEFANQLVFGMDEYSDEPDKFDVFEERQYQYALLGLTAAQLAEKLQNHANLSAESNLWCTDFLTEQKNKIELRRKKREETSYYAFVQSEPQPNLIKDEIIGETK
jgi:hypothetical protein